jgi:hypothetical protein
MVVTLATFKRFPDQHPQWFVTLVISIFVAWILFSTANLVNIALRINELKRIKTL